MVVYNHSVQKLLQYNNDHPYLMIHQLSHYQKQLVALLLMQLFLFFFQAIPLVYPLTNVFI